MIVSNALPIQFWADSQQTYNEKEVCGINQTCWCQPVQCDDLITIAVTPEGDEDVEEFSIIVLDEDGLIVYESSVFSSSGVLSFTPEDEELCDGKYQVVIYNTTEVDEIIPANQWEDGTESNFTFTDTDTLGIGPTVNGTIYDAYQDVIIPYNGTDDTPPFDIDLVIEIGTSGGAGWLVQIEYLTALGTAPQLSGFTEGFGDGTFNRTISVTDQGETPGNITVLRIWTTIAADLAAILIHLPVGEVVSIANAITHKSDCLDILETHDCTEVITYTNSKPFAGIDYDVVSPALEFSLRVPTVFFHEVFQREDEVHPLSNDTFKRLSSTLARKKRIDFGFMPYYMIQKLHLIFCHDSIEIDGEDWVLQDPYEINEGGIRYPLKKSSALLTDKNFTERNLI